MITVEKSRDWGRRLRETIGLPYSPVAIRFYEDESDVPECAMRPYRDKGVHYGMCQVISLVKTQGITVALTKEDHWCWKPLMAYGLVDCNRNTPVYEQVLRNCGCPSPDRADYFFQNNFPMMPRNDNRVIVVAPMESADFVPDLILCYCANSNQCRDIVAGIKKVTGKLVSSEFDYMDSCVFSVLPTHYERDFRITLPDPGEVGRACCPETELILSMPIERVEVVLEACEEKKRNYAKRTLKEDGTIHPDFPRPQFYNELFEMWGLQTGEVSWNESQRGYKI